MGWKAPQGPGVPVQRKIFTELTEEEEKIVSIMRETGQTGIDEICNLAENTMSRVSAALLNLEFEGIVRCLPGKEYLLV
jgi:DNA processing protein